MIFVTEKTPREAGGYVQFFNSPSTCKNFIYWFLRVKNPHGWPEALFKIWNQHVTKAFSVNNGPKTWDGFETTSINWIWKQWVIEYWNWTMVTCRGRKELFWYLEKLRFLLSKKLWKNQNPLMGLQELFAKLFLYLEKISTFFGSPKILVKPKCPYEHSCSSAQFWRHPKNALQKYSE